MRENAYLRKVPLKVSCCMVVYVINLGCSIFFSTFDYVSVRCVNVSLCEFFQGESSTPEPKVYSEEVCHENGLSYSLSDSDTEHLSSSLEAEHRWDILNNLIYLHTNTCTHRQLSRKLLCLSRLLKAMGWQEYPENDDNFLPLTEDELREFQTKTEQVRPQRKALIKLTLKL